tara:strand:+ start:2547 stop:2732 length:186 start_codon:yes stop_codon:yes gene_type:complete
MKVRAPARETLTWDLYSNTAFRYTDETNERTPADGLSAANAGTLRLTTGGWHNEPQWIRPA